MPNSSYADVFPLLVWKTAVSKTFFNFLFGGGNKAGTRQVLDKSSWRNKMPQAKSKQNGVFVRWRCVCMYLHASLSVTHILTLWFYLTMRERGIFALHTLDSLILPPQWNDCGKKTKE